MPARSRSLAVPSPVVGYHTDYGGTKRTYYGGAVLNQTMTDVTGNPFGENAMSITASRRTAIPVINGTHSIYGKADNLPASISQPGQFSFGHLPTDSVGSYEKVLAEMAPSEPQVSVPLLLYELPELPLLWKTFLLKGKSFKNPEATPGSDAWVAYNFGLKPLVSDLYALAGVAEWVNQRQRMLINARKSGYIRRQRVVGIRRSSSYNGNYPYSSIPISIFGERTDMTIKKVWVSGRWAPTGYSTAGPLTDVDSIRLLLGSLGLDLSFSTLFEAIPWSWLADWCTTLPAIVKLHSNRMGLSFQGGSLMTNTLTKTSVKMKPPTSVYKGSGVASFEYETKVRTPVNPTLLGSGLSIIGAKQVSILAGIVHSSNGGKLSKHL